MNKLRSRGFVKNFELHFNILSSSNFKYGSYLLNLINYLLYGWISFIFFYINFPKKINRFIKIHFYYIIIKKLLYKSLPTQIFYILHYLLKSEKFLLILLLKSKNFLYNLYLNLI